eukprot:m.36544 g.36544  ORF g.36544 m.36544 type:complete len:795 (-) comp9140_c0_seq2:68-2452(-)
MFLRARIILNEQQLIHGSIRGHAFANMFFLSETSTFDISGSIIEGSIHNTSFSLGTYSGLVNWSHCVIMGNIENGAFTGARFLSNLDMNHLTLQGSLGRAFVSVTVGGGFNLFGSKFHDSINFGNLSVSGNIDLGGTVLKELPALVFHGTVVGGKLNFENSRIENIALNAFYESVVFGNLDMSKCNLGNIEPGAFDNLNVYGAVTFTDSTFQNNSLPPLLFLGLRATSIKMEACGIASLAGNSEAGPFFGLGLLGSKIKTLTHPLLDLSRNKITIIHRNTFAGLGAWNVSLDNNNISILEDGWSRHILTASAFSMENNPSVCSFNNAIVSCHCSTRISARGTGSYCGIAPCLFPTVNAGATNGRYYPQQGTLKDDYVSNGDYVYAKCKDKFELAENSSYQLQCLGGQFSISSPLVCLRKPINWHLIGDIAGATIGTLMLVLALLYIRQQQHELRQFRKRDAEAKDVLKNASYEGVSFWEIDGLTSVEKTQYMLNKTQYSAVLQDASSVIAEDDLAYRKAWAQLLRDKSHASDLLKLDEVEMDISSKLDTKIKVVQPAIANNEGAEYVSSLQARFREVLPAFDDKVKDICVRTNCEIVIGSPKGNDRIFEKAELCYGSDLRRISDIARRSYIFDKFSHMSDFLRGIAKIDIIQILRIKNRFSNTKFKHVKDTAGYRDLQVIIRLNESKLLVELQLHIRPIYIIKSGDNRDASGLTGHDQYILFRAQKEKAFQLYMSHWQQLKESHLEKKSNIENNERKVKRYSQSEELQSLLLGEKDENNSEKDDLSYAAMEDSL